MHEVICPHCGKAFTIDEAGYADIVKQVRDREFTTALHDQLEVAGREKAAAIELAAAHAARQLAEESGKREAEIARLKAELASRDLAKQLAVVEATSAVERERDRLALELEAKKSEQQSLEI